MKLCFALTILCLLTLAGCTKESPEGGPGAVANNGGERSGLDGRPGVDGRNERRDVTDEGRPVQPARTGDGDLRNDGDLDDNVFTLVVPRAKINVEPGKKEAVAIKINREDEFRQNVRVMIQEQPGITIEPPEAVIADGSSETKFLIGATIDAPRGEKALTVVAIPQSGREVTMTLDVHVDD